MDAPTIGQDVITVTGTGGSPLLVVGILVMLAVVLVIICTDVGARKAPASLDDGDVD